MKIARTDWKAGGVDWPAVHALLRKAETPLLWAGIAALVAAAGSMHHAGMI